MNLIVDQGNTVCKLAVCRGLEILEVRSASHLSQELLASVMARFPQIRYAIYSTVGHICDDTPRLLEAQVGHLIELSDSTPVPIKINYDRRSLGGDRLAAVVGASCLTPERDLLVIDAGTAITYERVSAEGVYMGGNISPGLHVRLKALHHFTNRLPLVDDVTQAKAWGETTITAMQSGALLGLTYEMEGYIERQIEAFPEGAIYLTGGDADLLHKQLNAPVLLSHDLVLIGLAHILEYNKERC